ncbi:MAG TPA: ABC transporter permease [Allosphingosinicella sp.]|nr:ABC transporter permease [Allosphingosinicella sp.]
MMGKLQGAWVIGRRDFMATVMSRTFIIFLIFPVFIIAFSVGFGIMSAKKQQQENHSTVAVLASAADYAPLADARARLKPAFEDFRLVALDRVDPEADQDRQARALLASPDKRLVGVLAGGFDAPRLTGAFDRDDQTPQQVTAILNDARLHQGAAGAVPPVRLGVVKVAPSEGALAGKRADTGRIGQWLLFMVTVMLAGMLLSNMVEEKSNKVIEVLAAAIPVDSIFLGKLAAMLTVSLTGLAVWVTAGVVAANLWPTGGSTLPAPAVGWPLFLALGFVYFAMNYLLLGALFLGIGSQASSVREVQTISMPVTIGQVVIFFVATMAATPVNGPLGIGVAIFPFSTPMMMISRAAQARELWPHLVALLWLAAWVWVIIRFGAAFFRSNVLKSGGGPAAAFGLRRRA